jgi:hypothetical protein
MSTYSEISDDYKMFETKAEVDFHNNITNFVTVEQMMEHMFAVLAEYDRCMANKQDAKINPMTGRVSMRVQNGLSFEIPENVQKLAIVEYLEMKNRRKATCGNNQPPAAKVEGFCPDLGEDCKDTLRNCLVGGEEGEEDEEDEGVDEVEDFTVDLGKMVPKSKEGKLRQIIMVVLVLIALYALYRYLEECNVLNNVFSRRPNF